MNYGNIKFCDIADGVGVRTSLFVSGCTHRCKGCFQPETWDFAYGREFDGAAAREVLESLEPPYVDGLTVLGGEPFEPGSQRALAPFLEQVKAQFPEKTVWAYTGDVFEDLTDPASPRRTEATDRMLACIDVLVDGPYVQDLHDIGARFRGSSNQRILDVPASLAAGCAVDWRDPAFAPRGQW